MGLRPFVSTMTQKLRTSTWQQDFGMAKTLPMNQKIPAKWSNRFKKVIQMEIINL